MNRRQKKQLWRLSVIYLLLIALLYRVIELLTGGFPPMNRILIYEDVSSYLLPKTVIINFPFAISWWWNLAFAFLVLLLIVRHKQLKTENDKVDINYYSFFMIAALVALLLRLTGGLNYFFIVSLLLPFPLVFFYTQHNQIGAALFIGLISGLSFGLAEGIITILLFLFVCYSIRFMQTFFKSQVYANFIDWVKGGEKKYKTKMRIVRTKVKE